MYRIGTPLMCGYTNYCIAACHLFSVVLTHYAVQLSYFRSRKIHEHKLLRIGQNRIFRVLNFREWTEKLIFFVVLRKRLDPDRNKREKKPYYFKLLSY